MVTYGTLKYVSLKPNITDIRYTIPFHVYRVFQGLVYEFQRIDIFYGYYLKIVYIMLDHIVIELLSTAIFIFVVFLTKNYLYIGIITALIIFVSNGRSMFNPAIALVNYVIGALSLPETSVLIIAQLIGALIGFQLTRLM